LPPPLIFVFTVAPSAAGGGKTFALLLECLRNIDVSGFGAVFFRRSMTQIVNEGGLWDNAKQVFPLAGGVAKLTPRPTFTFPSGAKVTFAHLQTNDDVHGWQGSQITLLCFDELCHFTEKQFFYMLSRNRSVCGVRPYVRATCNPDADSWVATFIDWWIDQKTGYPIKERSGVLRWFIRLDDKIYWADSKRELVAQFGDAGKTAKSVTFIASSIFDNKILLDSNPDYLANLNALSTVERERLLKGNWKIRPAAGLYFPWSKAQIVERVPGKIVGVARAWDLAATEISETNKSPDRTAGALVARLKDGRFILLDVVRRAFNPAKVRELIRSTAEIDREKWKCSQVLLPQDPGQAGKEQAYSYASLLAGFAVSVKPVSGNKVVRAEPFAAQWQASNVLMLKGGWNEEFLTEAEGFPDGAHDDQIDAAGDAFKAVASFRSWQGLIS